MRRRSDGNERVSWVAGCQRLEAERVLMRDRPENAIMCRRVVACRCRTCRFVSPSIEMPSPPCGSALLWLLRLGNDSTSGLRSKGRNERVGRSFLFLFARPVRSPVPVSLEGALRPLVFLPSAPKNPLLAHGTPVPVVPWPNRAG